MVQLVRVPISYLELKRGYNAHHLERGRLVARGNGEKV
jgi:hypothetical protein